MVYSKKQLARLKKSKKRISDAIKKSPRAPPSLGPLGQAYNVLRRVPEPFIDASQYAFGNRALFEAAERERSRLEMNRMANQEIQPGSIVTSLGQTAVDITPSLMEIEALAMAATDEELLDEELVSAVIQDIETAQDVIRNSRQFSRANIVGGINLETPKRTRKKTKTDKNMSKALRLANEKFRKKNGQLRKGATQAQIMKFAHKLLKKM